MAFEFAAPAARLLRTALVPAACALTLAAAPVLAQDAPAETPATEAPATETPATEAPATEAPAAEAPAQPAPVDPSTVLATVGGQEITEGDLAFAAEDLAAELQQIPADQQRAFLLTVLIDMKVMAQAARDEGLADGEDFTRRLSYLEDRALRSEFFGQMIQSSVTPEAIQETYEELVADFSAQPEVRARHILVETEEQANDILAEIEGGKTFEDAASEYGTDGTAANGGDLGYFGPGMMVPEFEEAAFALEAGQISDPVQSQFGWHIIKLEDRRMSEAPPLEEVQQQVAQQVLYENFEELVGRLKEETEVVIDDEDLAAAVEAQNTSAM